jgi:hypothetical protein
LPPVLSLHKSLTVKPKEQTWLKTRKSQERPSERRIFLVMKSLTKQKKGIKFKINIILTRKLLKKINLLMICGIGITLLMVMVCVGVLK